MDYSTKASTKDVKEPELQCDFIFLYSEQKDRLIINASQSQNELFTGKLMLNSEVTSSKIIEALQLCQYQVLQSNQQKVVIKVLEQILQMTDFTFIPKDKLEKVQLGHASKYHWQLIDGGYYEGKPPPKRLPDFYEVTIVELIPKNAQETKKSISNPAQEFQVKYFEDKNKPFARKFDFLYEGYDDVIDAPENNFIKKEEPKVKERIKRHESRTYPNDKIYFEGCQIQDLHLRSNVVENQDQSNIIDQFFKRSIESVRLVYCASENGFSVEKFHELSKGVSNTLVLVETEFGKKIGGFTPLTWQNCDEMKTKEDPSKESFIFLIRRKYKFELKNESFAIRTHRSTGPAFGDDLVIKDLAHENNHSSTKPGSCYYHNFFQPICVNRNMKFNGHPDDKENFKIVEWEVWEIKFNE